MLNNFQLNTSLVYQSALLRRILNATVNASVTVNATASVFGSCRKKGSAGTAGVCLYSTSMLAMFSKLFSPGQMQFLIYYLWYLAALLVPAWGGRQGLRLLLWLNSAIWSAEAGAEAKQKVKLWLSSHFVCKYGTFIKKIFIFLWTRVGESPCVCVCCCVNLIFYMPVCVCVLHVLFVAGTKAIWFVKCFWGHPKGRKGDEWATVSIKCLTALYCPDIR